MTEEGLARAAEWLAAAQRVVVSTGAGMSRESGIPTFRDALEGLWAQFDPQELATEAGFRKNPRRVWSWYASRRRKVMEAVPHAGYHALVELERLIPSFSIVTQNVDGLHALAGSGDVVEVHGNLRRAKCLDGHHPFPGDPPLPDGDEEDPPPCPVCGSPLRPDVVWFGEMLPADAVERAWKLAGQCDVLLLVGTSGTVWPAAELPYVAQRSGARVIEINPESSDLTPLADVFLPGRAGSILPRLARDVAERRHA